MFRNILSFIDWALYSLASAMFDVIKQISVTSFFKEGQIEEIASRVYVIVGVLMLFKLVVSAIQYLVNPDSMDDKEKGLFGVLKNSIITVGLIVLVPVVFRYAVYELQTTLVEALPTIIFGAKGETVRNDKSTGETLSYTVLSSFLKNRGKGGSIGAIGDTSATIHDITTYRDHLNDGCDWFGFGNNCHYDFMPFISAAAGAFLIYILLSMALDIAIRTIKLGIIQMLAPIPISSYVIKKDNFNKFVKIALQVYGDLFIRMSVVYFIIFAIQNLIETGILDPLNITGNSISNSGNWFVDLLINITIIFGLLMFAKSAPKFITDLLGLPEITGGDLSEMFKPAWKRVGGLSGLSSAVGSYRSARGYGEGRFRSALRGLTGGASGIVSRLRRVASGEDFAQSYGSARQDSLNRTNRNLEYRNRYPKFWQRHGQIWRERFDSFSGMSTGGERTSASIDAANRALTLRSNAWNRAQSKIGEHADRYDGGSFTFRGRDGISRTYDFERLNTLFERNGTEAYAGEKDDLARHYQSMKDRASVDFLRQAFAGTGTDRGDGQSRNVFAEDVLAISRSGGAEEDINRLLIREVEISGGRKIKVDAIKAANRINELNKLRDSGEPIPPDLMFTAEEAEALAVFASDMNKVAGSVRLDATQRQTSKPNNSDGKK